MAAGYCYCLGIISNDFFLKDNKKAFILGLNVPKVTAYDHRILLEADFLVNSFEAHLAPEGIITFRDHVFRSESAISMLNDMWGL